MVAERFAGPLGRAIARSRAPRAAETGAAGPARDVAGSFDDAERALVERVQPYTMTTPERIVATTDAVAHLVRRDVPGAFVECGVWRGGTVLAMILRLQALGVDDRDLYLYDTFEGMTPPSVRDTSRYEDEDASTTWTRAAAAGSKAWDWLFPEGRSGVDEVTALLQATGYPSERLHIVAGPVETTLPEQAPDTIALLRLDTDWYESTRHELVHLYPRVSTGGVLLVDDYGHWEGCRRAVDEYFATEAPPLLLARTDYTGRMAVKC
jgi:O-methyltransferase